MGRAMSLERLPAGEERQNDQNGGGDAGCQPVEGADHGAEEQQDAQDGGISEQRHRSGWHSVAMVAREA